LGYFGNDPIYRPATWVRDLFRIRFNASGALAYPSVAGVARPFLADAFLRENKGVTSAEWPLRSSENPSDG
jgi:hypothetical protein